MSKFPVIFAGQRLTASLLNAAIPNVIVKTGTNGLVSGTLSLDPELSGIALGVGTWSVEVVLVAAAAASATSPQLQTGWSFTGTFANSPVRITSGPGTSNTATPSAATPANFATNGTFGSGSFYGLRSGGAAAYARITEECHELQVSSAGTFGILLGQATGNAGATNAVATNVRVGSMIRWRQIG
jgi:hypothetical protein